MAEDSTGPSQISALLAEGKLLESKGQRARALEDYLRALDISMNPDTQDGACFPCVDAAIRLAATYVPARAALADRLNAITLQIDRTAAARHADGHVHQLTLL